MKKTCILCVLLIIGIMAENKIEVLFGGLKNSITEDRTKPHNDATPFARLFVLFIAAMELRITVNAILGKEHR